MVGRQKSPYVNRIVSIQSPKPKWSFILTLPMTFTIRRFLTWRGMTRQKLLVLKKRFWWLIIFSAKSSSIYYYVKRLNIYYLQSIYTKIKNQTT